MVNIDSTGPLHTFLFSFKILRFLSIDIVVGAIGSSILAAGIFKVKIPFGYWFALAGSIWIIYLTDHLFDSFFLRPRGDVEKQHFFAAYKKFICFAIITFAGLVLLDLYFLPFSIVLYGAVGGTIVVAYLLLNQFQSIRNIYLFPRELIISVFYTYGTWGVPLMLNDFHVSPARLLFMIAFWLLVLSNVLIYSYYDYENDRQQQVQTVAVRIGRNTCRWISILCQIISLTIFVQLWLQGGIAHRYIMLGIAMDLILMHILAFKNFYARTAKYGVVADLVFLAPLVLVAFN